MKRVGITGGIGCGKSTVVAAFERLGVPCFVADSVAAEYYLQPAFVQSLTDLFGNSILTPSGLVDKARLASIVFADKAQLAKLNALVHPRVKDDFDQFCQRHEDSPYVLFESAILYDYRFDRLMDKVICVYLDLDERLRRLQLRDHAPLQALQARIANQMPAERVMELADYVILNYEGNPREHQVAHIHQQLISLST